MFIVNGQSFVKVFGVTKYDSFDVVLSEQVFSNKQQTPKREQEPPGFPLFFTQSILFVHSPCTVAPLIVSSQLRSKIPFTTIK